ncbi:NUDIX hydrolase [Candidatus Nitrosarchaeum limnium SFB1]|uniref:NUDIX hydrolase n=1 Tax=Candidatus Nitrosarchaeum limnium SFB1 TaxID=886738 RepID=F3KKJ2_9ARCH|nr:NUDIX hydrolase [Candidatus Nitrosarchaeum limnium SFB1]
MDLKLVKSSLSSSINPVLESNGTNKLASVLVVIYGKEPIIVMTEKPENLKFHAGEISFPGGKLDPDDSDLLETALRETREEIGLRISKNQVIGQLKPVMTLNSGFTILPFVSIVDNIESLSANAEVKTIFHIPLEPFLKTMADDRNPSHNIIQEMYTFEFQNKIVWGASARILKQIVTRLNF